MSYFDSTAQFLRGVFGGIMFTLIVEIVLLYVILNSRFKPPSQGERPSSYPLPQKQQSLPLSDSNHTDDSQLEHLLPWPSEVVAYLRSELTPDASDVSLVTTTIPTASTTKQRMANTATNAPTNSTGNNGDSGKSTHDNAGHVTEPIAMGPVEECHWLNVVLQRFFLCVRDSQLFKQRWTERMSLKLNMRLKTNPFVTSIKICDLCLGDHVPEITGIRLLKGVTKDLAVVKYNQNYYHYYF